VPPVFGGDAAAGASVRLPTTPVCVTVKVRPAIVIVPLLVATFPYVPTEYPTVPLPVPEAPEVTVSHDAFDTAVRAQSLADAERPTDPVPPVYGAVIPALPSRKEHPRPACTTVVFCPAMVTVPLRCDPLAFADTVNPTEPLPVPEAPEVIAIHATPLDAVQAHPVCVVTVAVPVSPAAPTVPAGKLTV
jgi:hypothetical protein